MANILDRIVEFKKREVFAAVNLLGLHIDMPADLRQTVSMSKTLADSETGIIAEFKRRSPSKGDIHPMADVAETVSGYENAGASACSILTDTPFFGGSNNDLMVARQLVRLPLLRKEFIIHPRQIEEARAIGADAVLLIASILTPDDVSLFTEKAHELGLEVLLELHDISELDRYNPYVDMIGVNNRDLTTFNTDTATSEAIAERLPDNVVKVAESGLTDIGQVKRLRAAGYRGFLIGETFMKHTSPGDALRRFLDGSL